jgi:hypothetical protein
MEAFFYLLEPLPDMTVVGRNVLKEIVMKTHGH